MRRRTSAHGSRNVPTTRRTILESHPPEFRFADALVWLLDEDPVELLIDERIDMRLLFVISQLDFPSLVVQRNEFAGRVFFLVQERRQQHVFFLMSDALRVVKFFVPASPFFDSSQSDPARQDPDIFHHGGFANHAHNNAVSIFLSVAR